MQKFKREDKPSSVDQLKKFNSDMYNLFQFKVPLLPLFTLQQLNEQQYFLYKQYQQNMQQQEVKKKEKIAHSEHQK